MSTGSPGVESIGLSVEAHGGASSSTAAVTQVTQRVPTQGSTSAPAEAAQASGATADQRRGGASTADRRLGGGAPIFGVRPTEYKPWPAPHKGQTRSWLYQFFGWRREYDQNKEAAVCLVPVEDQSNPGCQVECGVRVWYKSGQVSGLKEHMKRYHEDVYEAHVASSSRTLPGKALKAAAVRKAVATGAGSQLGINDYNFFMDNKEREEHNYRYVLMCAVDLRPFATQKREGFKLFVGGFSPAYAVQTTHLETCYRILDEIVKELKGIIIAMLKQQRDSVPFGPFCSAQIDLTTCAGRAWVTFSCSFVDVEFVFRRVTLGVRNMPGDHPADKVKDFIVEVTHEFFGSFMPQGYKLSDIFVAASVDQGGNVVNAWKLVEVAVQLCSAHRLSTSVHWGLGVNGSEGSTENASTCLNPQLREIVHRASSVVKYIRDSSNRRDKFAKVQQDLFEEDVLESGELGELRARHEVRWEGLALMFESLHRLKTPIQHFFESEAPEAECILSTVEWRVITEVASLLEEPCRITKRMQGGQDGQIGHNTVLLAELKAVLCGSMDEDGAGEAAVLINPIVWSSDMEPIETPITKLHPATQKMLSVIVSEMDKRNLGKATNEHEFVACLLDPRYKGEHYGVLDAETTYVEARTSLSGIVSNFVDQVHARDEAIANAERAERNAEAAAAEAASARAAVHAVGAGSPTADEPVAPPPKRPKSMMAARKEARLKKQSKGEDAEATTTTTADGEQAPKRPERRDEVDEYLSLPNEPEDDDFDLLAWWKKMSENDEETRRFGWRILPLIARVYHGIDATSCQAERNFSLLALLLSDLRASMQTEHIEDFMFVKTNVEHLPMVRKWRAAMAMYKDIDNSDAKSVATASSTARKAPVVDLR